MACSETSLRKTREAPIVAAAAWGAAQDAALARGVAPREVNAAFDENSTTR